MTSRPSVCPRVVLVIPRGEAVRNFLYSETLATLREEAQLTLLSVIHDEAFLDRFGPLVKDVIPLQEHREARIVGALRKLIHEAHFRWLWSEVARNRWEIWDHRSSSYTDAWDPRGVTAPQRAVLAAQKFVYRAMAQRWLLRALTRLENRLSYRLRPTGRFDKLFSNLRPDLVFNGSHIHGNAAFLPMRVAHRQGFRTAGFVFSWDNLTSRSRIMEPYDALLVWHEDMKKQFLSIYPEVGAERVFVTGTPQFDFHFRPGYWLERGDLARRIGFDPERPFLLYTTGIDAHFPEEHRTVDFLIRGLAQWADNQRPQLVVRTYVKGTSDEMRAIAAQNYRDVFFPQVAWDERWYMPAEDDLAVYTSLLRECSVGINAASTVSLELLIHDKPVINLAFDPPGTDIPNPYRWARHLAYDHYRPVAESGAVMVASSPGELVSMVRRAVGQPDQLQAARRRFLADVFGSTLDGNSGRRVAECLLALARGTPPNAATPAGRRATPGPGRAAATSAC